ncbi:Alpha,alpha-trehalose-phosphate synthase [UDP-forming] 5 [Acorus calamus]|uniref:Alpha,alpha-trehalose-phosphate synthase [UDP-forming] 5 n=1 Tax=Acorus calamus TaxID=4465 RepID=A0AAV9CMN0_ACOCL|nr:Alpha,alpha-trehalose-phosphate synthase [UDP-forming] 5 [Acorus calamus]
MASRSCVNLLDLASSGEDFPNPSRTPYNIPRVMTVPGIITADSESDGADSSSSAAPERRIIVANQLPLKTTRSDSGDWDFEWDDDSLVLQLKDGLSAEAEVVYVGCLKAEVDPSEQDEIAQRLLENYRCVPVFLPSETYNAYYHGFCKHYLWPLLHYMLPLSPAGGGARFEQSQWRAYVAANKAFADKVTEVLDPDEDRVWAHDYHLMLLPTFLRKRSHRVRLGFFLHSPFPSSEIYRTIPVREELLRSLLNSDLVGFHTFDYARHFLSCCSRMLGLDYESKRGYIGLEYYGRTVGIKILPVGIHMGQLESVMSRSDTTDLVRKIRERFLGKTILLGVDDMDLFKGISLKFLAMGQLLEQSPELRGKVVLVQIANPARSRGGMFKKCRRRSERLRGGSMSGMGARGMNQLCSLIGRSLLTRRSRITRLVSAVL